MLRTSILTTVLFLGFALANAQTPTVSDDATTLINAAESNPNDFGANFNLANYFYQHGIQLIEMAQKSSSNEELRQIQEKATIEFHHALPYAQKCFHIDGQNVLTLRMLSGIYLGLNMIEESDFYANLAKANNAK